MELKAGLCWLRDCFAICKCHSCCIMRCPSSSSTSTSHHAMATKPFSRPLLKLPHMCPNAFCCMALLERLSCYGPLGTALLMQASLHSPPGTGLLVRPSWFGPPGKSVHMANIYACSRGLCGMGVLLSFQPFPYAVLLACSYIIASLSMKQQAIIWEPDF